MLLGMRRILTTLGKDSGGGATPKHQKLLPLPLGTGPHRVFLALVLLLLNFFSLLAGDPWMLRPGLYLPGITQP